MEFRSAVYSQTKYIGPIQNTLKHLNKALLYIHQVSINSDILGVYACTEIARQTRILILVCSIDGQIVLSKIILKIIENNNVIIGDNH